MLKDDIINGFLKRQNDTTDVLQRNKFSKEEYEKLLYSVLSVLNENKDASLEEIREKLYEQSGLEEILRDFYLTKLKAPGAVISFGTDKHQDKFVIGNKQEVDTIDGRFSISIKPNGEDTIYDLASVTKLFTSVAVLQLVGNSHISLSDKVKKYLPEFKNIGNLTIYDLLIYAPLITERRIDSADSFAEAEQILFGVRAKTSREARSNDRYNDIAPMVLKYIVEKVTGIPFEMYVKENILDKAGMQNTFVKVPAIKYESIASNNFPITLLPGGGLNIDETIPLGYSSDKKAVVLGQPSGKLPGHAGLFATCDDMVQFSKSLIDGTILQPELVREISKNRTQKDKALYGDIKYNPSYGFLCNSKNHDPIFNTVSYALSGKSLSQSGWSGTYVAIDPLNNINLTLLSNRTHNRVISSDPNEKNRLASLGLIDSSLYGFERKVVTDACIRLAIQEKMLEEIFKEDVPTEEKPKVKILKQ